jgi:hypothetical protein
MARYNAKSPTRPFDKKGVITRAQHGDRLDEIAEKFACTIEKVRETIRDWATDVGFDHAEKMLPNDPDRELREKGIAFVISQMSSGNWHRDRVMDMVSTYGIRAFEVRNWEVAAQTRLGVALDPAMITAFLNDTLHELRRLADEAEQQRNLRAAIAARKALADTIVSLARTHTDSALAAQILAHGANADEDDVRRVNKAEENRRLIAAGWCPPVPDGLPAIAVDDSEMLSDAIEAFGERKKNG